MTSCRHVGGQKQYIFSSLGNKIYFYAISALQHDRRENPLYRRVGKFKNSQNKACLSCACLSFECPGYFDGDYPKAEKNKKITAKVSRTHQIKKILKFFYPYHTWHFIAISLCSFLKLTICVATFPSHPLSGLVLVMSGDWRYVHKMYPPLPLPLPNTFCVPLYSIPCHRWNSECTLPEVLAGKLRDGIKNICIYPTFHAEI